MSRGDEEECGQVGFHGVLKKGLLSRVGERAEQVRAVAVLAVALVSVLSIHTVAENLMPSFCLLRAPGMHGWTRRQTFMLIR